VDIVNECINSLRASLSVKMNWNNLKQIIKEEKKKGNPSASIIHKLKIDEDKVTILLYDKYLDEVYDEEEETKSAEPIDIIISLSAHANATEYYNLKKKATEKKEKTIQIAENALKSAEKNARKKMQQVKTKNLINKARKQFWFEKFNWFISTDNYIVISGRDVQQNEILYRRYLQKGDLYFHADIHGASSVICKNPDSKELPPKTLQQAGNFAICYSSAWKNKVVTSAYWVNDHQVSKTARSGEYLTQGSFMIRGTKNELKHTQLVMGFALLFKIADESLPNHLDERKPKYFKDDNEEFEHEKDLMDIKKMKRITIN